MNDNIEIFSDFISLYRSHDTLRRQLLIRDLLGFPRLEVSSCLPDLMLTAESAEALYIQGLIYAWRLNKVFEDRLLWEMQKGELAHYAAVSLALGGCEDAYEHLRDNIWEQVWPDGDLIRYTLCSLQDNVSIRLLKNAIVQADDKVQFASALICAATQEVAEILLTAMTSKDASDQYYGVINSWSITDPRCYKLIRDLEASKNPKVRAKAFQAEAHLMQGPALYDRLFSSWSDLSYFYTFPH